MPCFQNSGETRSGSKKDSYVQLRRIISQDEVLVLVHRKRKGLRGLFIYAVCGRSLGYFDRAYKKGDVILHFGKSGSRLGMPLSW